MLSLIRHTLRRAREERLAQVAAALTFTTVLAIVPLAMVSLALFTRFPAFKRLEQAIEQHLIHSLFPAELSRTALKYVHQFADNAHGLTLLGSLFVLATAVAMLLTVENALNQIWEVKRNRPLPRRVGLYLLTLALGPPLLGASLWATSYVLSASLGLIRTVPPWLEFVLTLGPAALSAAGLAAAFYFLPNTRVRRRDAIAGGLLAGIAFELGKRGFAAYVLTLPTYRAVYGAFAAFPVFLLWLYFSWLVTLAAALVAASLGRNAASAARARR